MKIPNALSPEYRLPRGVSILEGVQCTEVFGTSYPREGELIGYAIAFGGKHDSYLRSGDGSLIHFGTFDRHEDAIERVLLSS